MKDVLFFGGIILAIVLVVGYFSYRSYKDQNPQSF